MTLRPSPRPTPTRSTVAPQKHNASERAQHKPEHKPVPRPVRKLDGPTQKLKPKPRGKPVPRTPRNIMNRTQSSNQSSSVFPNLIAQYNAQFGPNGSNRLYRAYPNPPYLQNPNGYSSGDNPLHSPHSPHSPYEPPLGYLEQKEVNLNSQNLNQNPLTRKFRAPAYHQSSQQTIFKQVKPRRNKNQLFGPNNINNYSRNTLLRRKARSQARRKATSESSQSSESKGTKI